MQPHGTECKDPSLETIRMTKRMEERDEEGIRRGRTRGTQRRESHIRRRMDCS